MKWFNRRFGMTNLRPMVVATAIAADTIIQNLYVNLTEGLGYKVPDSIDPIIVSDRAYYTGSSPCARFNGGDHAVSIANRVIDVSTGISIYANVDSTSVDEALYSFVNDAGYGYLYLYVMPSTSSIYVEYSDDAGTFLDVTYDYTGKYDTWHKLTVKLNVDILELYCDDVLSAGTVGYTEPTIQSTFTSDRVYLCHIDPATVTTYLECYACGLQYNSSIVPLTDAIEGKFGDSSGTANGWVITSTSGLVSMQYWGTDVPAIGSMSGGNLFTVNNGQRWVVCDTILNQGNDEVETEYWLTSAMPSSGSLVSGLLAIDAARILYITYDGYYQIGGNNGYIKTTAKWNDGLYHDLYVKMRNNNNLRYMEIDGNVVINNTTSTIWPINVDRPITLFAQSATGNQPTNNSVESNIRVKVTNNASATIVADYTYKLLDNGLVVNVATGNIFTPSDSGGATTLPVGTTPILDTGTETVHNTTVLNAPSILNDNGQKLIQDVASTSHFTNGILNLYSSDGSTLSEVTIERARNMEGQQGAGGVWVKFGPNKEVINIKYIDMSIYILTETFVDTMEAWANCVGTSAAKRTGGNYITDPVTGGVEFNTYVEAP